VTNRRTPAKRPTASKSWKPPRPRYELAKAIGGGAAVVLVTALLIFIMKPADTGTSVPDSVPVPPATQPTGITGTTGTTGTTGVTGANGESGTSTTIPSGSTTTSPAP
jgi:hypothetical protein